MTDEIMRRAAELSARPATPPDWTATDGSTSDWSGSGAVIRRSASLIDLPNLSVAPPSSVGGGIGSLDLDTLVDAVVERIEQRVVDELERRGRRQIPGLF